MFEKPLTLLEYNTLISNTLNRTPSLRNVWVTGETSDVRISSGHCYFELLQKNENTGAIIARIRAIIWASAFQGLAYRFLQETGQRFSTGIKVMVQVSANFHQSFGLSVVVSDIDCKYTLGDVLRHRREIIQRLASEGYINWNKEIGWNRVPQRVAIISARTAAGYGDFMKHLYQNKFKLKFNTSLYVALMQGEQAVGSILNAMMQVYNDKDKYDCLVIIRGGGATTDLLAFDNYELAKAVACFPIPVIVGIGHDRDETVLDYVANKVVKTPTAAADILINSGADELMRLQSVATTIHNMVAEMLADNHRQLAYYQGLIPSLGQNRITREKGILDRLSAAIPALGQRLIVQQQGILNRLTASLPALGQTKIAREKGVLDKFETMLPQITKTKIAEQLHRLESLQQLIKVLSPEATLKRGYSITLHKGKAVRNADDVPTGEKVETLLAKGSFFSTKI